MKDIFKVVPEGEMKNGLYSISYFKHCEILFDAYKRERALKILLIATNALWLTVFCFSVVVGWFL